VQYREMKHSGSSHLSSRIVGLERALECLAHFLVVRLLGQLQRSRANDGLSVHVPEAQFDLGLHLALARHLAHNDVG
jgi:hypothetical protein